MKSGIELIAEERQDQITKHGRSTKLDVELNYAHQLVVAASFLVQPGEYKYPQANEAILENLPYGWDSSIWLKICYKPQKERNIIAGALIAAEIDRLNHL